MRVLIVGAGPTGLSAAVELARRGVLPDVIEKRPTPSQLSRAVGLLPGSMQILEPSGVAARIDAEAVRFAGIIFHRDQTEVARLPLNFDRASRLWGLAQDRTEHHLAQALGRLGGEVRYGTAFETLEDAGDAVAVRTSAGAASYDWVIGADGIHSTVREALGLPFEGHDLPDEWSIADVEAPGWRSPAWFQGFLKPHGNVVVVVPLETERFRVIASLPDALAALPVPMPVADVRNTGQFRISVRQVPRYLVGRVALAGDAAHCHSPVGGRGMNLGIADAAEIARRIVEGGTGGYHAARHAEGTHVLKLSERGRRAVQAKNPLARLAVVSAMRLAAAIPPLGRAAAHQLVDG